MLLLDTDTDTELFPGFDTPPLASLNDFGPGLEVIGGAWSCCTRLEARLEDGVLTEDVVVVPNPPSLSSTVFKLFLLTVCIPWAGGFAPLI